jgi:hypothetical protein
MRIIYLSLLLCCTTLTLKAQLTTTAINTLNYIATHKQMAINQMLMYKIPASITIAQGIIETKAGNSELAVQANNHFGIKCKRDWAGNTYTYTDDAPNECFRAYDNAEESYNDHSQFLTSRAWYNPLFELHITDYEAWAFGLKTAGYATDKEYANKLIHIIETYELNQYDVLPTLMAKNISVPSTTPSAPYYRFVQDHILYYKNNSPFIIVNRFDTYYRIAKAYNLKLEQLYKYNDINPETALLRVDDVLYLKQKQSSTNEDFHIVKYNETPLAIAQMHAIKLKSLTKINKISIVTPLIAGTIIYLNKKAKRTKITAKDLAIN